MSREEEFEVRRGPWTFEEDTQLNHYISCHGEGRWNLLAKCAGLKRTGKSCRLRWLNYLKPDIKRGNLSPQEQLLILELHSKWGNRWSKIAQHLPGRTDNEIKNYWRTRVQKQARQLKIDSNSKKFLEALRHFWMPRLLEKAEQSSSSSQSSVFSTSTLKTENSESPSVLNNSAPLAKPSKLVNSSMRRIEQPENSEPTSSESGYKNPPLNDCYHVDVTSFDMEGFNQVDMSVVESVAGSFDMATRISISNCQMEELDWINAGSFWNLEELW